jgi:hypothetical protein
VKPAPNQHLTNSGADEGILRFEAAKCFVYKASGDVIARIAIPLGPHFTAIYQGLSHHE